MSETRSPSDNTHYVGRVKWFNSKAGYGFLTVTDGEKSNTDVFVHHSQIRVGKEQYRYLVQGEYVEFDWVETDSSDHEYQAGDVRGVSGGLLMCETRNENRGERPVYNSDDSDRRPRQRYRGGGARDGQEEWMLVRRRVGGGNRRQSDRATGDRNQNQERAKRSSNQ